MFQQIWSNTINFFTAIPFTSATWVVMSTLMFFVWLFAKANNDKTNSIRWEHLIVDSHNDRASPYKTGYLVGLIVSTWLVISYAEKDKLTYDIFGIYLTYLLSGAGWNSVIKLKETQQPLNNDQKDV